MFDLIHLAYQANVTRVASYIMVGRGHEPHVQPHRRAGCVPPVVASREQQGPHRQAREDPDVPRAALRGLRRQAREDAGRRGLAARHSMLMYGSNMSNSDRHNNYPLPHHLGRRRRRRTCAAASTSTLPEYTTFSNLHLTVVNKAGLEMKSIGRQHRRDRRRLESPQCVEAKSAARIAATVLRGIAGGLAGLSLAPVARVGLAAGDVTAAPVTRRHHAAHAAPAATSSCSRRTPAKSSSTAAPPRSAKPCARRCDELARRTRHDLVQHALASRSGRARTKRFGSAGATIIAHEKTRLRLTNG